MSSRKSPPRGRRAGAPAPPRTPTRTRAGRSTAGQPPTKAGVAAPSRRTLVARVRELTALLEKERAHHARRLAAVRRKADRELAAMMQEIAALRHHEARAAMLARVLQEHGIVIASAAPPPVEDSRETAPRPAGR